jgi:hypothetical protein
MNAVSSRPVSGTVVCIGLNWATSALSCSSVQVAKCIRMKLVSKFSQAGGARSTPLCHC